MKNELKISTISIVCVLCASVVSGAYAASSVRSLGGAGTYTSAASASKSGASTGVARAGSVRISPTTTNANTAKPSGGASVTAGRVAASPRLSLGKYLGGKTAISGGSSTRPGGSTGGDGGSSMDPGLAAELNNRVNVLEDSVADLKTSSEDLLENKQDKLTGDDYIEIDNNGNVSLIVENLKQDLAGIDGADGREVAIDTSADGKYIVWQYDGDTTWQQLIAIEDLVGPQGEKGEKGDPGDAANLDQYSTTLQMNQAIADAINGYVKSDTLSTMLAEFPTNEELDKKLTEKADASALNDLATKTELATKADADKVYDKTGADQKFATKEDLAGVETGAGTALTDALKNYATTTELATKGALDTVSQDGVISNTNDGSVVRGVYVDPNNPANVKVASGKIGNKSIADNAEIARSKLATDVRVSLLNADSAIQPEDMADVERTTNLTQTIAGADTASASKYTSEKAVATALTAKADTSALTEVSDTVDLLIEENSAINETLATKASTSDLDTLTEMVASDLDKKANKDDVYTKAQVDEKIQPVTNFETKMTELTTTVENNMQTLKTELQTELAGVSNTVNNITNDQGQVVNIAPNSITNVELKDGSVTNVKLADGAVTKDRLADDVKNELVGKAEGDDPDGMYVLLVTPNGERVWADLAVAPTESGETSGGATN